MKAIICTIPSDSHSWNLIFMDLYLQEKGFETKNLGVCTSLEHLILQTKDFQPNLLVISSINGHAYIEAPQMIRYLKKSVVLNNISTVLGGKIGIQGDSNLIYKEALLAEGFDAVFVDLKDNDGIADFNDFLDASFSFSIEEKSNA